VRAAAALAALFFAAPLFAQDADSRKLMRGYLDTFRILGRAKMCRVELDAEPYFREVARRHGEASDAMSVARLGYAAGAEDRLLGPEIDPAPPAPMPCDVIPYMKGISLPELPPSLAR
jgi:hypothetical protein